jgi:hypothetical protein
MSLKPGKLSLAATVVALAAGAAVPSGASAALTDSQTVTGTVIAGSLAVGTPAPALFGTSLGTDSTADTTGGVVALTVIGPWTARVSGTNAGKLAATTALAPCLSSTPVLNNALTAFATATLGNFTAASTTGSPQTLSGTATPIASGIGSNVVTLTYRHNPNASDQLTAGCTYAMTSTVAIAAS